MVALWTVDIRKDICVIPFQMQVYSSRFTSLHSASLLQEHFTERGRGRESCLRSNIVLIYPLVVTNRGIMAHCLLKKPLAVPLVMFPSSSYYTSMHFQQTDRALRPLWVAWERRKTGEFVLPAETCVLVFHRMSAWSIWALRWHRITRLKVPCRDIESIWWRTVRRKLLNICFCSGIETLSRWRVVGETYFPFQICDLHLSFLFRRYDLVQISVTFPVSDFKVTFSLCGSWALPVGLVELIVFWWQLRRWLTYLVDA